MWDASDEAVLAGLGAGDVEAAAVFVRRFQHRVYGLALAVLGDEGRAAEVAQDAFVKAWRHAATYDPRRGSPATWLLAITRNLAIDRHRMEAARPATPMDPELLTRVSANLGTVEGAVTGTEVLRVVQALSHLPEPQRRCVVLATIGGRTALEISAVEGIPLGTAKTRIRDGLGKVRAELAGDEDVSHD